MTTMPKTQHAVQLVAPDTLKLNTQKEVPKVGPTQILGKVQCTGLCFSDLKLIKRFSEHPRKGAINEDAADPGLLAEIPSYVPDTKPGVPGHETVVQVAAIGDKVKKAELGGRYLVETDYRWFPTEGSNGSFGYNFEGGLQQYVLFDERIITSPEGELFLIPVPDHLSASAVALVEPWACVEDAYITEERQGLKQKGDLLVYVAEGIDPSKAVAYLKANPASKRIWWYSNAEVPDLKVPVQKVSAHSELEGQRFDDILFLGADAGALEKLYPLLGHHGLLNIVQCNRKFQREVRTAVGRVHYEGIRITGTPFCDPEAGYCTIPPSGEIRKGDTIDITGAAGPMGTMHVVRNLCQGVEDITVLAGDISDERLELLSSVAVPLAEEKRLSYEFYNPRTGSIPESGADYSVIMVPDPRFVAQAVKSAQAGGIINIFAGIGVGQEHPIDFNGYVQKQLFLIGTSGSTPKDMKIVLEKIRNGALETNLSVAAVCGLDGVIEGIRAVENRTIPGKIMVYPECRGLGLTPLSEIGKSMPEVAKQLSDTSWTKKAEEKLLERFSK